MADQYLCRTISKKEIPTKRVYEDMDAFAFEIINPRAPSHILICPHQHFAALHGATAGHQLVLDKIHLVAGQLARELNLLESYRTIFNGGPCADQSVFHLHLHPSYKRPILKIPHAYF